MKKIIIPTDYSENAIHAFQYAIELFKGADAHFYILNTFELQPTSGILDKNEITTANLYRMLQINSEAELEKLKNNKLNGFQFEVISKMGRLPQVIKELIEKEDVDLIVMGAKGASKTRNIFGSHTLEVINKRICPVLVIPDDYTIRYPKNILLPTDLYVDFTDKHLRLIADLAKHTVSSITILHRMFRGLNVHQRASKEKLDTYLKELPTKFEIIEDKSIEDAIFDFEHSHPTDILAMINNKHSFLENLLFTPVVSKIVKNTSIPFLVIPS